MSTLAAGPAPTLNDILRLFSATEHEIQEADRMLKERAAENDCIIKAISENLGNIGDDMRGFIRHRVAPTVVQLLKAQGIEAHEVHPGVQVERGGESMGVDLLVVNDGALVAVECKSKLTREDVDRHLRRMEKLKRLLPTYRHHQAFGAVAAMVVPGDVADYAQEQGFYVLAQSGETVEVRNDSQFSAKAW
ncbi:MAG: hypothetical protein WC091_17925 [Sulfuricellaceae bacterium]